MVIMNNVNTTERLIQEVRARPPLWDQRNLNYHNRVVVNALWQDIADSLQINKETVKVKWKGLRDTYRRELKKQRNNANSSITSETIRDPSWTHYSSMNFLREYMGNNNNNNHGDIFQFHGWSAEEMPSADEASTTNDDGTITLCTFASAAAAAAAITDLVGNNDDTTPPAGSTKSSDSASEDEAVRGDVKAEPRSPETAEKPLSPVQPLDINRKGSAIAAKKSKTGEKKRSTTTSTARWSRMKEHHHHHRLRTKLSRKHPKGHHHHPSASLAMHQHGMDVDDMVASATTAVVTQHKSRGSGANADESDDDLYFFKSLIPYVKNLSPTRKLCLRSEIHNLVLRELMSDGSPNSVIPLEHVAVGLNA